LVFQRRPRQNIGGCLAREFRGVEMTWGRDAGCWGLYYTADAILGQYIVGEGAGEMISEIRQEFVSEWLRPMDHEIDSISTVHLRQWIGRKVFGHLFFNDEVA
jgi:hypothetical protein